MAYELTANLESEYVYLKYTGILMLDQRMEAKNAVFELCFEKGLHRSLIDLRASDIQMSASDIVNFASSFKDTQIPENYRLAVIISEDNQSDNLIEIIISIDGINVKYFFEFNEALSWLTSV